MTDLLFGQRVGKASDTISALGDVDELMAALGLLRVHARLDRTQRVAAEVQQTLIGLMGELATPSGEEEKYAGTHMQSISAMDVEKLDVQVRELEAMKMTFKGWVLPGAAGSASGAAADMARAVCRRAERSICALPGGRKYAQILRYMNRLSDVLWLLARAEERTSSSEP
jgi:cob(I)alamin adenosyltransferase